MWEESSRSNPAALLSGETPRHQSYTQISPSYTVCLCLVDSIAAMMRTSAYEGLTPSVYTRHYKL